jgi:hypothetical protein
LTLSEPASHPPSIGPEAVAIPAIAARFMLHMKQHGIIYAVGWLVLDATGTWATVTAQAGAMC